MSVDFAAAEQFMLREARVLERRRFEHRFHGGSADAVVTALLAYRNGDGGFGNALESDLRGRSSSRASRRTNCFAAERSTLTAPRSARSPRTHARCP